MYTIKQIQKLAFLSIKSDFSIDIKATAESVKADGIISPADKTTLADAFKQAKADGGVDTTELPPTLADYINALDTTRSDNADLKAEIQAQVRKMLVAPGAIFTSWKEVETTAKILGIAVPGPIAMAGLDKVQVSLTEYSISVLDKYTKADGTTVVTGPTYTETDPTDAAKLVTLTSLKTFKTVRDPSKDTLGAILIEAKKFDDMDQGQLDELFKASKGVITPEIIDFATQNVDTTDLTELGKLQTYIRGKILVGGLKVEAATIAKLKTSQVVDTAMLSALATATIRDPDPKKGYQGGILLVEEKKAGTITVKELFALDKAKTVSNGVVYEERKERESDLAEKQKQLGLLVAGFTADEQATIASSDVLETAKDKKMQLEAEKKRNEDRIKDNKVIEVQAKASGNTAVEQQMKQENQSLEDTNKVIQKQIDEKDKEIGSLQADYNTKSGVATLPSVYTTQKAAIETLQADLGKAPKEPTRELERLAREINKTGRKDAVEAKKDLLKTAKGQDIPLGNELVGLSNEDSDLLIQINRVEARITELKKDPKRADEVGKLEAVQASLERERIELGVQIIDTLKKAQDLVDKDPSLKGVVIKDLYDAYDKKYYKVLYNVESTPVLRYNTILRPEDVPVPPVAPPTDAPPASPPAVPGSLDGKLKIIGSAELKRGSSDTAAVRALQVILYGISNLDKLDGIFGGDTEIQLNELKKALGLAENGKFDAETITALKANPNASRWIREGAILPPPTVAPSADAAIAPPKKRRAPRRRPALKKKDQLIAHKTKTNPAATPKGPTDLGDIFTAPEQATRSATPAPVIDRTTIMREKAVDKKPSEPVNYFLDDHGG